MPLTAVDQDKIRVFAINYAVQTQYLPEDEAITFGFWYINQYADDADTWDDLPSFPYAWTQYREALSRN